MNSPFELPFYRNVVRIHSKADGSCFFHSFLHAFYVPYREQKYQDQSISRFEIVKMLRNQLADLLAEPTEPLNPIGPTNYDVLSRGKLKDFSQGLPQYSLTSLQQELRSMGNVDNAYQELLSNLFDVDIYIVDEATKDVRLPGPVSDLDLLYKHRNSIVLLYSENHYDLLGVFEEGEVYTYFSPKHPFIVMLRERLFAHKP